MIFLHSVEVLSNRYFGMKERQKKVERLKDRMSEESRKEVSDFFFG